MLLERLPLDQPLEHWLVTWSLVGETFDMLCAYAEEMRFGAGDIIFSQGDPSDGMYLILEGMALIFTTDKTGGERALSLVTEGQSFGELGLLTGQPRNASVAAGLESGCSRSRPTRSLASKPNNPTWSCGSTNHWRKRSPNSGSGSAPGPRTTTDS